MSSSEFAVKVPALVIVVPLAISMNPLIQFNEAPDSIDRSGSIRRSRGRRGWNREGSTVAVAPDLIVVVPVPFLAPPVLNSSEPVMLRLPAPPRTPESVMVVAPLAVPVTPEPKFRVPAFVMVVGPVFTVVGEDTVTELASRTVTLPPNEPEVRSKARPPNARAPDPDVENAPVEAPVPSPPVRERIPELTETVLELTNSTPTVVVPVPEVLRKVPVLVIGPTGCCPEKNGRIPLSSSEFAVKVPALVIVVPLAISMNPLIHTNEAPDSIDRVRFDPSEPR